MTGQTSPVDKSSALSEDAGWREHLEAEVAPLAYAIWQARGRPEGTDREDWFEAERRLREQWGGRSAMTPPVAAEQTREASESRQALDYGPSIRDRMVEIGRGHEQAGRQGP